MIDVSEWANHIPSSDPLTLLKEHFIIVLPHSDQFPSNDQRMHSRSMLMFLVWMDSHPKPSNGYWIQVLRRAAAEILRHSAICERMAICPESELQVESLFLVQVLVTLTLLYVNQMGLPYPCDCITYCMSQPWLSTLYQSKECIMTATFQHCLPMVQSCSSQMAQTSSARTGPIIIISRPMMTYLTTIASRRTLLHISSMMTSSTHAWAIAEMLVSNVQSADQLALIFQRMPVIVHYATVVSRADHAVNPIQSAREFMISCLDKN